MDQESGIPKTKVDFSKNVDENIQLVQKLCQKGNLTEAFKILMSLEKQTRTGADTHSCGRVLVAIVRLCFETKNYAALNEYIILLTKPRTQIKQAVTKMIQECCTYIDQMPDKKTKLKLIDTLRQVTAGKIFLEEERVRVTHKLVKIKEDEKKYEEARKILQELEFSPIYPEINTSEHDMGFPINEIKSLIQNHFPDNVVLPSAVIAFTGILRCVAVELMKLSINAAENSRQNTTEDLSVKLADVFLAIQSHKEWNALKEKYYPVVKDSKNSSKDLKKSNDTNLKNQIFPHQKMQKWMQNACQMSTVTQEAAICFSDVLENITSQIMKLSSKTAKYRSTSKSGLVRITVNDMLQAIEGDTQLKEFLEKARMDNNKDSEKFKKEEKILKTGENITAKHLNFAGSVKTEIVPVPNISLLSPALINLVQFNFPNIDFDAVCLHWIKSLLENVSRDLLCIMEAKKNFDELDQNQVFDAAFKIFSEELTEKCLVFVSNLSTM